MHPTWRSKKQHGYSISNFTHTINKFNKKCYKNITEILKKYYKWAKRIEKQILKGYNNLATMVKQKAETNKEGEEKWQEKQKALKVLTL